MAIKPLDWVKHAHAKMWRVYTPIGVYTVSSIILPASWTCATETYITGGKADTEELAFKAAWEHYERQVQDLLIEDEEPEYVQALVSALEIFGHYGDNIKMANAGRGGVSLWFYNGTPLPKRATYEEDGSDCNEVDLNGPISPDACVLGVYSSHDDLKGALMTPVLQAKHFIAASDALDRGKDYLKTKGIQE